MTKQSEGAIPSEPMFDALSIYTAFEYFLEASDRLDQLEKHYGTLPRIKQLCFKFSEQHSAIQALGQLYQHSQLDFHRALFCSWFAHLVARSMKLSNEVQYCVFAAGLLQDIGKYQTRVDFAALRISRSNTKVLPGRSGLVNDDHPLISSSYIDSHLENAHVIAQAVLHHHARADGYGYPAMVGESQLSVEDQLLVVSNEIADRLDKSGTFNAIDTCIAPLRLGSLCHMRVVSHSAYSVLKEVIDDQHSQRFKVDLVPATDRFTARIDSLQSCVSAALSVSALLVKQEHDSCVRNLRSLIEKLSILVSETGVLGQRLFEHDTPLDAALVIELEQLFSAFPEVISQYQDALRSVLESIDVSAGLTECEHALHLADRCIKQLLPLRDSVFRHF